MVGIDAPPSLRGRDGGRVDPRIVRGGMTVPAEPTSPGSRRFVEGVTGPRRACRPVRDARYRRFFPLSMLGFLRKRGGRPMLPEVRLSRPSIDLPPTDYKHPSRTHVRKSVRWCPTSALRSSARTGTDWDRTGWSWDGHRAPAQQPCAPREPPDTAPTCASSAMRRSSFPRTPGHRSPGCSGRRDRRRSSRGPARKASEPAGSQTRRPTRIQNISVADIVV